MAETKNIHQRILAIMAAVPYVQKVQRKTGLQYTFVNRDAVVSKLRVAMVEHGVVYYPTILETTESGNRIFARVMNTYANADAPDDRIQFETIAYGIDPQDKGPGKAMTYAEKLAHLKLFMIEAGDEDEAEHYDDPATTTAKGKKATQHGDVQPADVVKMTMAEAKAAYSNIRKISGLTDTAILDAFGKDIKKATADEIAAFVKELEKRWLLKNDLCDAVDKLSPSQDAMTAALSAFKVSDVVDWHLIPSESLSGIVEQLYKGNDK